MNNYYRKSIGASLVLVYLVIVAGALVRMTGSGMGCPDWPKCFGYYIPPTEISELQFQENRHYESGQVIIVDEKLFVAAKDFTSTASFRESDWKPYTKHDYAIFNPVHTWIEYLNRLLGALSGLAVLLMTVFSFLSRRQLKEKLFTVATLFLMGFQAWIGATVVYSVLNPIKITIHMLVALLIVGLLFTLYHRAQEQRTFSVSVPKWITGLALALTLLQIAMGTQVRQFVDEQVKGLGIEPVSQLLHDGPSIVLIHRSFSILVFALAIYLFVKLKNTGLKNLAIWQLFIVGAEVFTGILMYYVDFPFGSQTLHLVFAALLFGCYYLITLRAKVVTPTIS